MGQVAITILHSLQQGLKYLSLNKEVEAQEKQGLPSGRGTGPFHRTSRCRNRSVSPWGGNGSCVHIYHPVQEVEGRVRQRGRRALLQAAVDREGGLLLSAWLLQEQGGCRFPREL